jgi:hypothetical protein
MSIRIRFFISSDDLLLPTIFDAINELDSPMRVTKLIMETLILRKFVAVQNSARGPRKGKKSIQIELRINEFSPCLTDLYESLLKIEFHSGQVLHIKKLLAEYSKPQGLPATPQIIQPFQEDSSLKIITSPVNSLDAPAAVPPSTDDEKAFSQNIKSAKALFKSL